MKRKTRLPEKGETKVKVVSQETLLDAPKPRVTRSSSRLAKAVPKVTEVSTTKVPKKTHTVKDVTALATVESNETASQNIGIDSKKHKTKGNEAVENIVFHDASSDSDGLSSSSSSAEDSDDDYEKEKDIITVSDTECSSDEDKEAEDVMKNVQKKIDRETKKKRLLKKEKQYYEDIASDNDDIVCEFESSDVAKQRRRRLYRRRMMKSTASNRRRRIQRISSDVVNEHSCDTFVGFGTSVKQLTTDIDWDDVEIDQNAVRKLFKEIDAEDDISEQSGEDEADIIAHSFQCYQSRNAKERVSQMVELKMTPFSEKLAGFNSQKAVHGPSRSSIKNYHPGFFIKQDIKLPEELIWEQPFTHLLYVRNQFDAHEKCNNYLNKVYEDKKKETEKELLEEIRQTVHQKAVAQKREKLYNKDELVEPNFNPLDEDFAALFSDDRMDYEDDDFQIKEDPDFNIDDF